MITIRPEAPGNKSRKGREVPVPADLLESLADLASLHAKEPQPPYAGHLPAVSGGGYETGSRSVRLGPGAGPSLRLRHTYGRNCVLRGVPIPVLQQWLVGHQSLSDTQRYVELAGTHHSWVGRV